MAENAGKTPVFQSKVNFRAGSWWEMLKMTYEDWSEDKAPRLGAALAYYTVFSLAPMLIIVLAIAGLLFDAETVRSQISQQIGIGEEGEKGLAMLIAGAEKVDTGILATILGVIAILFGATGVFVQTQDALNTIWEVEPKPGQGVWAFIKNRVLSFAMVLTIGFLLLVLLVVSAALQGVQEYLGRTTRRRFSFSAPNSRRSTRSRMAGGSSRPKTRAPSPPRPEPSKDSATAAKPRRHSRWTWRRIIQWGYLSRCASRLTFSTVAMRLAFAP